MPIRVFISHASKDKKLAGVLRDRLQKKSLTIFLAHDTLKGGEEWMRILYDEIKNCDVFLILLSKEYHKADFTDQEAGMALAMNKPVIPISLNKQIPYGFLKKYQAVRGSSKITNKLVNDITDLTLSGTKKGHELIDMAIGRFANSTSFEEANILAGLLSKNRKFSKKQINNIALAVINNDQVSGRFKAISFAMNVLRENSNKINPKNKQMLKKWLR